MDRKGLIKAAAAAFMAQGITAAVSALSVFLLAGVLDASDYGLWQLFTLAASYSGLFHLGLCDGVYLRLGGQKYNELSFYNLGRQFWRMFLYQVLPVLFILVSGLPIWGGARLRVLCLALVYMPFFNASAYLGYILQATGRTPEYSMSTVIDRISFAFFAVAVVLINKGSYINFIYLSIAAKMISLGYCVYRNREIVFAKRYEPGGNNDIGIISGHETRGDIAAGSKLLWANLSGQLISGAARIAIILRWGDAEFGRISFIMTLSGLFLQFAAQLGMVAYPSLRQKDGLERQRIIVRMRSLTGILLPAVFLIYLPVKLAVTAWLPQYANKIGYLALLLPICLFEGRTQIVNQTYLKVSRMEKRLLTVNLVSAGLSVVLCFFSAFWLKSTAAVLISAVLSSALRSYMSESYCVKKGQNASALMTLISDTAISSVFIISSLALSDISATAVFVIYYIFYIFIRRNEIPKLRLGKA